MTSGQIPEKKLNSVRELEELVKSRKTILICSIKNIPASQFQIISKNLRGKAIIKVPKKNIIFRALDSSEGEAGIIKERIKENFAVLFSDLDSFELALELVRNKTPAGAKAGQDAPDDVEIPAGPTDLMPGPAISELGALGIPTQIQEGKIAIKSSTVIVKQGEKISETAASIMNKLEIKPFSIGFEPLAAFDTHENKLYSDVKVDQEQTLELLKEAFGRALPFAVEIGHVSDDTIKFLLAKAASHETALGKLVENSGDEGEAVEEKKEEAESGEGKPEDETKRDENQSQQKPELSSEENK